MEKQSLKPSDTNCLPRRKTFFVDRCLGNHFVAEGIRAAGLSVEVMDDHFDDDTVDADWIPVVAKKGWIIVTKDHAILRKPLERAALSNSRASYVGLAAKRMTGPKMATVIGEHIMKIHDTLVAAERPLWFRVHEHSTQIVIDNQWTPLRVKHQNSKAWRRMKKQCLRPAW